MECFVHPTHGESDQQYHVKLTQEEVGGEGEGEGEV